MPAVRSEKAAAAAEAEATAAALAASEAVLLAIHAELERRRVRAIDIFRKIPAQEDGTVSHASFREGLAFMGFTVSDQEFGFLMARLDGDSSGGVTLKEFDRALRAAVKAAGGGLRKPLTARVKPNAPPFASPDALPATARQPMSARVRLTTAQPAPLEKLAPDEEPLIQLVGKLNKRKTRLIDEFKRFDTSGDGTMSAKELRAGFSQLGVKVTEEAFAAVMARIDNDGSGEVELKEIDKALKIAEKKAKAENRHEEVDTFARTARNALTQQGISREACKKANASFDWAVKSVRTDTLASRSVGGAGRNICHLASSSFSAMAPADATGSSWRSAAHGPKGHAFSATVGSGSPMDGSSARQRIIETYGAPGATPPSLAMLKLPVHHSARSEEHVHTGRFAMEPGKLQSSKLMLSQHKVPTSFRVLSEYRQTNPGGVKKFLNTPMMQSTVDSVVYGRDMDCSGNDKFDEEFMQMFEGMAGVPSWRDELRGR